MNTGFEKAAENIYLLRTPAGGVWSSIVFVDGEEKALIDSGDSETHIDEMLVPALGAMGYTIGDIDWILNTHCHADHVGGHRRLRELGGRNIAVYEKSVPKIRDPLKYARRIRAAWPEHSPSAPEGLKGVMEDWVLAEGDVAAGRLKLVASPGHDDDCVCFYDIPTKTLISGDSLQGNGTVTQGTALYMNLDDYRATLEKLSRINPVNIVSAHPYLVTGEMAQGSHESQKYLEKCMQITQIYEFFLQQKLQESVRNPVSLARELIDYMGNKTPEWLFLPLYTVKAHIQAEMNKMEAKGI